jgi:hypothetical protein
VHFVGPAVASRPRYYATCDIFCSPVAIASFGMTLLEAMASGKPIVATVSTPTPAHRRGFPGAHGGTEAFADAIVALLADEPASSGWRPTHSRRRRAFPDRVVDETVGFYHEILNAADRHDAMTWPIIAIVSIGALAIVLIGMFERQPRSSAASSGAARGPPPRRDPVRRRYSAHTPAVLDALAALDVKATFFVLGLNAEHPDIVTRAAREGHEIENTALTMRSCRWPGPLHPRSDGAHVRHLDRLTGTKPSALPRIARLAQPVGELSPGNRDFAWWDGRSASGIPTVLARE